MIDLKKRLAEVQERSAKRTAVEAAAAPSKPNFRERLRALSRHNYKPLEEIKREDEEMLRLMESEIDRQILEHQEERKHRGWQSWEPHYCRIAPDLSHSVIIGLMALYERVGWHAEFKTFRGKGDYIILTPRCKGKAECETVKIPW